MYGGFRGGVDGALEEGSLIITLVLPLAEKALNPPSFSSSHMGGGNLVLVIGIERGGVGRENGGKERGKEKRRKICG